jgi:hypothetical protein
MLANDLKVYGSMKDVFMIVKIFISKKTYTQKPHYFLCMHVQIKHNQIQKLRKKNFVHVLQMSRNENIFKFTSLYH